MKYSKEYIQNCNMLLITFMIVFGILGLIFSQKTESENEIQKLDEQLDQYEIELKQYQAELESENSSTSKYQEKYNQYEETYDEYMKVYQRRQELYKVYKDKATSGFSINSSILFLGIGILVILMIVVNVVMKKENR